MGDLTRAVALLLSLTVALGGAQARLLAQDESNPFLAGSSLPPAAAAAAPSAAPAAEAPAAAPSPPAATPSPPAAAPTSESPAAGRQLFPLPWKPIKRSPGSVIHNRSFPPTRTMFVRSLPTALHTRCCGGRISQSLRLHPDRPQRRHEHIPHWLRAVGCCERLQPLHMLRQRAPRGRIGWPTGAPHGGPRTAFASPASTCPPTAPLPSLLHPPRRTQHAAPRASR